MALAKISPVLAGLFCLALSVSAQPARPPQQNAPPAPEPSVPTQPDLDRRSQAYFEFTIGRLFEDRYDLTGHAEDANLAIAAYKKAYELDPRASVIGERLAETYAKSQRIREAVIEALEVLKNDPGNLPARRILGRIYLRTAGDLDPDSPPRETLKRALEQYREIVRLDPEDTESALLLARLYRSLKDVQQSEEVLRDLLARQPEQEAAIRQLAQLLIQDDRPGEAVKLLAAVAERSPRPEWLEMLGEARIEAHDFAGAEQSCHRALESRAEDLRARKCLAQALLRQEKFAQALPEYQRLSELEPSEAQHLLRLALIYRRLKMLDKAEESLLRAKQVAPGNLEVIYSEALTYRAQGRFEDAIRVLTDAIAAARATPALANDHGTLAILHEQVGMLYREVENYPAAIQTFQQMRLLGPEEDKRGRELLIDTYRMNKQLDAALEESRRALLASPDDPSVIMTHALLLGEKGEADQGAAMLRKLLRGTAEDFEVQLSLGQVYERSRRFAEAEPAARAAEKLARLPGEREMAWFLLAAIFERQKMYDQAEEFFRKDLKENPFNAPVLNYYGYMLAERGVRLEEAVGYIQRALDDDAYNGAYLDSLGWVYFKLNRLDDAVIALRKAVERSAQDPTIRQHLGEVYLKMGLARQAAVEWEKAREYWRRVLPSEYEPEQVAELERKLETVKRSLAQSKPGEAKQ
jgi:tetratricopeptide (TPR) repeat protein